MGVQHELAEARATISRQAEEIERLRRQVANDRFADELREVLRLAATTGSIAAPVTHRRLLQLIVETAAQVIDAAAGSLFLLDAERQELVFEVALGQKAEAVRKFRIPLGSGIAGLVAETGEPMAISDAQTDPRHATDIAASIGYHPESILCVPLVDVDSETVIGVLELLDKRGASSFSPADIAALSLFANQAALAIEQSQIERKLSALLAEVMAGLGTAGAERQPALKEQLRAFAADVEADPTFEMVLDLARQLREIARRGEPELQLCQALVRGVADYVRARASASALLENTPW